MRTNRWWLWTAVSLATASALVACDDDVAAPADGGAGGSASEAGDAGGKGGSTSDAAKDVSKDTTVDITPEASTVDSPSEAAIDAPVEAGDAADATAQTPVQRGQYLVDHVAACGDCHTPRGAGGVPDLTKKLAGTVGLFQVPGLGPDGGLGVVNPPNLTPDMTTGLGSWTAAQIKTAFLDGIDKNGNALFPIMPYFVFHNMTSADADAIVAYLQSLTPVANVIPVRNFTIPGPANPVPVAQIPNPTLATTDPDYASAIRGKYLAGNVGVCMECHTTHQQGPDPLDLTKLFAGGDDFPSAALGLPVPPYPATIFSENITPHATGLQGWTAAAVAAVLKQGIDKDGVPICPPMPTGPNGAFGGITDDDAKDIGNYIVHLPPIANTVTPICHEIMASDGGAHDAATDVTGN